MIKKIKLPTILGVILLAVGTFLGVILIGRTQIFRIGASGEAAPKDIRVTDISDSSLTISWVTDKETLGFVIFDNTPGGETDSKTFTHAVTISGLTPQKSYQYKISSDGTIFDNQGIPWSAQTGPSINSSINTSVISGTVITATGQPVENALVYANIGGYLLSTLTSATGVYVFQLGGVRTSDLGNYLTIDPAKTLVEIFAQKNVQEASSAQIFPQSARPVPAMVIGQSHDFRSLAPSAAGDSPNAILNAPQDEALGSKFSIPGSLTAPPPQNVTLDNISDGEIVTSTKPAFFGNGPAGTTITIKVESETPITEDLQIPSKGSWSWSVPENLAAGVHKITISWIDSSGITRTLTRNFVVQAGELPAFEATPSQSLSPTATPKATTKPSSTPASTIISSPTGTPPPTPVTGDLTPSVLFTMLGLGVLALSFVIWKYSNA